LQKTNPYWTCILELQKIAEHLKEKQKIICYLQNLRNLCVFLKTRQQAIQPNISLVHRIAPKIHSVVQENRIKAGCLANSSGLEEGRLKALISRWTLIKDFENSITQIVLYQPPEQPASTEELVAAKKTKQQELFWDYIDFYTNIRPPALTFSKASPKEQDMLSAKTKSNFTKFHIKSDWKD